MTTGLIFDIQRTSLYDGPGIRTAVFLKGCPLHCLWCHNPESQSRQPEISFRVEACTACGACAATCKQGAHTFVTGMHLYKREKCQLCGDCAESCLYDALKITGKETTVETVMDEVRRDIRFYQQSGGGLTLTGGEPMLQLDFTSALLQAARVEGIHTCLETCGWASQAAYERIFADVDLFLFDYKATDSTLHQRLTGVHNERILENLDTLYRQQAKIRLRCPLIQGVNDGPEHMAGIAALAQKYPGLEAVELLAYHNTGNSKYGCYGLINPLPELETTSELVKRGWLDQVQALGCEKAVLS